jgi:hypothetical protein
MEKSIMVYQILSEKAVKPDKSDNGDL